MNRKEVRDQTRNKILAAALGIFAKVGYRGASLDKIAKKVGMTKGALYWHFRNKLDLYTAVVDFTYAEYERQVLTSISSTTDPKQKLEHIIRTTVEFYRANPTIIRLYFSMLLEGSLTFESRIMKRTIQMYLGWRTMIADTIADGIRLKKFIDVDPRMAASMLIAILDGVLLQWIVDKKEVDLNNVSSNTIRILFEGFDRRV
jgi:AcrR family transcriptional regulator